MSLKDIQERLGLGAAPAPISGGPSGAGAAVTPEDPGPVPFEVTPGTAAALARLTPEGRSALFTILKTAHDEAKARGEWPRRPSFDVVEKCIAEGRAAGCDAADIPFHELEECLAYTRGLEAELAEVKRIRAQLNAAKAELEEQTTQRQEIEEVLYAVAGELGVSVDAGLAGRVADMRDALESIAANQHHTDSCDESYDGCSPFCPVLQAKDALATLGERKGAE
jgi:hypothetical protein